MGEKMISERLQQILNHKGWSQSQLAAEIHTHAATVNRWLRGKIPPSGKALTRVAEATGCDLEWLLTGQGEMLPVPEPEDWEEQQRAEDEQMEMDEWLEEEERKKTRQQTIAKLLAKTAAVLESDTIHHGALAGVINALYRAVRVEEKIPKPPPTGLKALRGKKPE